jgi:uncharacterized protein
LGPAAQNPIARRFFLAAGWVCVGLGIVGAFLPVMPTTVFMIAALACFAKGSPQAAKRLLNHPRFGPPLRAWKTHGAISERAKITAVSAMAVSWAIVALTSRDWMIPAVVGAILLAVAAYVITRSLPPDEFIG